MAVPLWRDAKKARQYTAPRWWGHIGFWSDDPVARGFIPARLRSSRKTSELSVIDRLQAAPSPPIEDKSPHHRDLVRASMQLNQVMHLTSIFEPENRWSFSDRPSKVASGL